MIPIFAKENLKKKERHTKKTPQKQYKNKREKEKVNKVKTYDKPSWLTHYTMRMKWYQQTVKLRLWKEMIIFLFKNSFS